MSTNENIAVAKKMVSRAVKDGAYREKLVSDPVACFQDEGIAIPSEHQAAVKHLVEAQITQFDLTKQYGLPVNESVIDPSPLDPANLPPAAVSAGYVTVSAEVWGVVVTLSDQAVKDLQSGQMGVAGITAAIAAAVAAIPGGAIPAAFVAAAAGVIAVHSAVIGLANRGKGVHLTWLWTVFACLCTLGLPLPTPVQ